ncbi:MAG TPA: hypothetical protein VGK93_07005 [Candidatus Eisenbacteria bacterium]|jgi:hypothetical protein
MRTHLTSLLVVLAGASVPVAVHATDVVYALTGSATTIVCPPEECTSGVTTTGSLTAGSVPPGAPTAGDFRLDLAWILQPTDPCRARGADGTLTINWSDGTITVASVTGRFRDSKPALFVSGRVGAGSTGSIYQPGDPCRSVVNALPEDPCVAGTVAVTGEVELRTK